MKIKSLFYLWSTFFVFISCSEYSSNNIVVINPLHFGNQNKTLSQIAESIQYIPLEKQLYISALYDVKYDGNYFYCASPQGILLYNKKGQFIRRIGNKGRGPEEYINGNHIAINDYNKDIIVLDIKRLLIYSISGKLKRTISLNRLGSRFGDVECNNGQIFLAKSFVVQTEQQWVVLDTLGQIVAEKMNPLEPFLVSSGFNIRMYKYNKKLHYWNHYNDTIYEIGPELSKAKYLIAKGSFRIPKERINDKTDYFIPLRIMETNQYLILDYAMLKNLYLVVYEKDKSEFNIVSSTKITEKELKPLGFINDLDAGLPFRPIEYCSIGNREYLFCWIDIYNIKTIVNSILFKNSTPVYPEKKKALEELANSLNENDNPVLMLVKLKE